MSHLAIVQARAIEVTIEALVPEVVVGVTAVSMKVPNPTST